MLDSLLGFFLSYLLLYKYLALFLIIFASAIIVPLPASALLLATGAFSARGYFSIWGAFGVAQGGNVLGDLVDYMLTRRYGGTIIRRLRIYKSRFFVRLEGFIRSDPGLTIFLTRFAGSLGPVVNFLSGFANVPVVKFLTFDILGNGLEIAALLFAGYLVGDYWEILSGYLSVWVLVLGAAIIGFVLFRIYHRRSRKKDLE